MASWNDVATLIGIIVDVGYVVYVVSVRVKGGLRGVNACTVAHSADRASRRQRILRDRECNLKYVKSGFGNSARLASKTPLLLLWFLKRVNFPS